MLGLGAWNMQHSCDRELRSSGSSESKSSIPFNDHKSAPVALGLHRWALLGPRMRIATTIVMGQGHLNVAVSTKAVQAPELARQGLLWVVNGTDAMLAVVRIRTSIKLAGGAKGEWKTWKLGMKCPRQ